MQGAEDARELSELAIPPVGSEDAGVEGEAVERRS
jgi:hypothetical protein